MCTESPSGDGVVRSGCGPATVPDCVHDLRLEEMDEWVRLLYNALRLLGQGCQALLIVRPIGSCNSQAAARGQSS